MIIELVPPESVGPVRIGMTMEEAESALADAERLASWGGLSVELEPGPDGSVVAIQVYRPYGPISVRYRGIDLLGTPAARVVEQLSAVTDLEEDEGGRSYTAPTLLLSLWRPFVEDVDPDEEQGHFFQSVLVARPGYDEGPTG
ncbi:hypothetical protein [Krasilnikoviella flava]|uniref:Uncharacterized protein n=1 Tax=Krasilnikoviella flava TaxID=526729 RepID=A0A1T5KXP8_9MICO|nr:hypothetical protein [Krasilnikoviella flava]SKC68461.1 hypothetical protein SAMN04324258_2569 [Krasilnikoviella flava]